MNIHAAMLLVTLALAVPQQAVAPAAPRQAQFEIAAGRHELPDLVARAAKFLGRNILWSSVEQAAQPNLEVEIGEPLTLGPAGCEDVVSALLYRSGFAMVQMSAEHELYEIINMQGSRRGEVQARPQFRSPAEVLARPNLYAMVLTTVPLEHVGAHAATTALRPLFTSGSFAGLSFGHVGNDRALLLQGFAPQVAAALQMLEAVDQPPREAKPAPQQTGLAEAVADLRARLERLEFTVGLRETRDR